MLLGIDVGLGPGFIVLHEDQAPPQKKDTAPNFQPMCIQAKRLDGSRCHLVCRQASARGNIVLDADPAPPPIVLYLVYRPVCKIMLTEFLSGIKFVGP